MEKTKKRKIKVSIVVAILLTGVVILTNTETNKFAHIEGIANKTVVPIQNALIHLKNKVNKNSDFFANIDNLKNENENLKKENDELKTKLTELEIIKAENATLRAYSDLSDKYTEYKAVPANIISKDVSNLSEIMLINVGTDDGVYANMAVISEDGIVGHTISATKKTAKVQPIIDSSSSVSGTMHISRDNLMVKGMLNERNKLKAVYIGAEAELVLNDIVETSGLGGIYPKGLKIGILKEIVEAENVTERYAIVETEVDFSKLETVLVITNEEK